MICNKYFKLLTKVSVAALALAGLATSGQAQTTYKGKFTLPFETRWGSATLPPGDYTFTLPSTIAPYTLYIRGEGVDAIIIAAVTDRVVSSHAQLNLADIADVQTVQTFDAPELGLTFIYSTPTQKHAGRKVVGQKTVPQTAPATQASQNKTSIEVHTAGR
jgi:hypothetical protein